jgi:hypothetical protein
MVYVYVRFEEGGLINHSFGGILFQKHSNFMLVTLQSSHLPNRGRSFEIKSLNLSR